MIITITPMIVAATDSLIIKREKDGAPSDLLNAMRLAINAATFNENHLSIIKNKPVARFAPDFCLIFAIL
jgi:hypothetical protein